MAFRKLVVLAATVATVFALSGSTASAADVSCGSKTLNGLTFTVDISGTGKISCAAATKVLNQFEKDTKSPRLWACTQTVAQVPTADGGTTEQRTDTCKPSARVIPRYKREKNKLLGVVLKAKQVTPVF